jgi:hypothetical protein
MKRLIAVAVLSLIGCGSAHAATEDGGFQTAMDLYQKCAALKSSDTYYQEQAYCIGYIAGAWDSAKVIISDIGVTCRYSGYSLGQIQMIFVKSVREHPENAHKSASRYIQDLITPTCDWSVLKQTDSKSPVDPELIY